MSNLSPRPMPFLSSTSANAIVSDLRPTSLSPPALHHVNLFLDELLSSLITSAQSINPSDLRATGIPAVFSGDKSAGESTGPRSLGRAAVGEAEMELRSWFDQNAQSSGGRGYPPGGKGRGMTDMKERAEARFPEKEAVQLMRVKVASFSTLASETPYSEAEDEASVAAWKAAGGDISASTVDPAGLWITAIIEHVCEHLLNRLSSVVARDSGNAVAGVQDLLTTLYEDETMYGFFKRMKVKDAIENAIKSTAPRSKRSLQLSSAQRAGRASPSNTTNGSPRASKTSLVSVSRSSPNVKKSSLPPNDGRGSSDSGRFANLGRKVSSATKRGDHGGQGHERAPSVLSVNTRSMIGAFNESFDSDDSREKSQDQDDFDALMRSGETMKVSLTPSRLKTFETPSKGGTSFVRRTRATSASSNSSPFPSIPKSESMPAMPRQSTPNRPAHLRSQPSSGSHKLVARGATTIDEGEDEDDDLDTGRNPKEESLKDLFGSEPIDLELDKASSGPQRTTPAVVLATPPPRDSSTINRNPGAASLSAFSPFSSTGSSAMSGLERRTSPTKASINRPGREVLMDDDDDFVPKRKPRSDARELADFLSNTPPPITTARLPVSEPPPSGRSSKSFRGFMSKFTGKKDDEKPQSPSIDEIPTAHKMPKRVRSSAGFSSVSAADSTRTAPAAYTRPDEPPLPTPSQAPRILRKKSDAATAAAFAAGAAATAALHESPRGKENKAPTPESQPAIVSRVSNTLRRDSDGADMAGLKPTRVVRDGPGLEDERIAPTTPTKELEDDVEPGPSASTAAQREHPVRSSSQTPKATPIPLDTLNNPAPIVLATPEAGPSDDTYRPSHMERVPTTSSDVNSFITADEGESEDTHATNGSARAHEMEQRDNTETPTAREENTESHARQPLQSSLAGSPPVPSIPIANLVPLRGLLDHATSVLECKMLLSAILTQFSVPQRAEGDVEVTPESRLAAWLLAGGYGPVDTGSSIGSVESGESRATGGTAEETTSEEVDEAITPTLKQSAQLETMATPTVMSARKEMTDEDLQGDTEEVLEHSERSSEASFSKEKEVEVGRPSIAKAARRESAMQLPTVSAVGAGAASQ